MLDNEPVKVVVNKMKEGNVIINEDRAGII